MTQEGPDRHFPGSNPAPNETRENGEATFHQAGSQHGRLQEEIIDVLIRTSLSTWREEIETHLPRWEQVQEKIFPGLKGSAEEI